MNNKEFKPYVPAEKITPEMTVTSVIMGMILAVVFGAANAYLGLRAASTVVSYSSCIRITEPFFIFLRAL